MKGGREAQGLGRRGEAAKAGSPGFWGFMPATRPGEKHRVSAGPRAAAASLGRAPLGRAPLPAP